MYGCVCDWHEFAIHYRGRGLVFWLEIFRIVAIAQGVLSTHKLRAMQVDPKPRKQKTRVRGVKNRFHFMNTKLRQEILGSKYVKACLLILFLNISLFIFVYTLKHYQTLTLAV